MNNIVDATSGEYITVNGESLVFKYEYKNFTRWFLIWSPDNKRLQVWEPENLACNITFDGNQEEYDAWVQPLVDLWQAEKDRLAQEALANYPIRKQKALNNLNDTFKDIRDKAHIMSSLGYEINAGSTANEDITGLLLVMEDSETRQFCDYYNNFHSVTKTDLQTLQKEIVENAQNLYNQKWELRTAIENSNDDEELQTAVNNINFTYMDFSNS